MEYIQNLLTKYPKLNTAVTYIKNNKYASLFIGAVLLMIIVMILMFTFATSSTTNKPQTNQNQQSTTSGSPSQSTISSPPLQITTPNPTEASEIDTQTQPQITPNVAVPYTISTITKYGDSWATMNITNPDVGSGLVIIQKTNGEWKVVLGPGSYFSTDQLQSIGAPEQLINHFTNPSGPSVSPSPSSSSSNDIQ